VSFHAHCRAPTRSGSRRATAAGRLWRADDGAPRLRHTPRACRAARWPSAAGGRRPDRLMSPSTRRSFLPAFKRLAPFLFISSMPSLPPFSRLAVRISLPPLPSAAFCLPMAVPLSWRPACIDRRVRLSTSRRRHRPPSCLLDRQLLCISLLIFYQRRNTSRNSVDVDSSFAALPCEGGWRTYRRYRMLHGYVLSVLPAIISNPRYNNAHCCYNTRYLVNDALVGASYALLGCNLATVSHYYHGLLPRSYRHLKPPLAAIRRYLRSSILMAVLPSL